MKSKRANPLRSIKPESRVGLAAMLSFLLLTGVLVYKKVHPTAAEPKPETKAAARQKGQAEDPESPAPKPANAAEPHPPIPLAIAGPGDPDVQEPAVAQAAEAPPLLPTAAEVETGASAQEIQASTELASADALAPAVPTEAAAKGESPPLPAAEPTLPLPPVNDGVPPLSIAESVPPVPTPVEAIGAAAPMPEAVPLPIPTATANPPAPASMNPDPVGANTSPAAATQAIPSLTPAPTIAPEVGTVAHKTEYLPLPNAGKVALAVEKPLGAPRAVATVAVAATATAAARSTASRPAAEPKAQAIEPIEHIVQSGENFGTISKLYYGTLRYYRALWKANSDRVPVIDQLVVGTSVRIPPPEALDAKLIDSRADQPAPKAAAKRAKPDSGSTDSLVMLPIGKPSNIRPKAAMLQPEPARPSHVVAERETLRGIARDALGDAHRAEEIYRLNRDVIDDPARLEPGTRLRLPADANSRSIRR